MGFCKKTADMFTGNTFSNVFFGDDDDDNTAVADDDHDSAYADTFAPKKNVISKKLVKAEEFCKETADLFLSALSAHTYS